MSKVKWNVFQCRQWQQNESIVADGPLKALQKKIDDKSLLPDDHQLQVVNDLQKLYEQVKTHEPKTSAGISKWFSFGQSKAEKPEDSIKGLYIYGSVGGGKTMLMDLFFDCCQVFVPLNLFLAIEFFTFPFNFRSQRRNAFTSIHSWLTCIRKSTNSRVFKWEIRLRRSPNLMIQSLQLLNW